MKKSNLHMAAFDPNSELPDSLLQPTLTHVERIERSLGLASRALHLEMAELIFSRDDQDPAKQALLRSIGSTAARIADMANQLSNSVDELVPGSPTPLLTTPMPNVPKDPAAVQERPPVEHVTVKVTRAEFLGEPSEEPVVQDSLSDYSQNELEGRGGIVQTLDIPSATTVDHKEVTKENFDLYSTVVPVELTPIMELPEGAEALIAYVLDANRIKFNDKIIKLSGDKLFTFNSMLMQRQEAMSADDIRAKGYKGKPEAFFSSLKVLMEQLKTDQIDIIKKIGERKEAVYVINPAFQLSNEAEQADIVKKN